MKHNTRKDTVGRQPITQLEFREPVNQVADGAADNTRDNAFLEICELLNQGDDQAANDAFDESYLVICELLNQVDYDAAGDIFDEDFSEISELRLRLRKGLLRGLCWIAIGVCLMLASFAIVTP